MASGEAGEKLVDVRTRLEIDGFFGAADNFLEATEKKHLDANGWSGRSHEEIVTRGKEPGQ